MNKGIIQNGPSNSSASLPELRAKGHLQVEVVLVTRARRQSRYRSTESAGRRRRRQGVRRSWSTEWGAIGDELGRQEKPSTRALIIQGPAATQPHGRRALCTPGTRAASAARARPAAGSPSKPASRRPSIARTPPSAVWRLQELALGIAVDAHSVAAAMEVVLFDDPGGDVRLSGWTVFHLPSGVDGK